MPLPRIEIQRPPLTPLPYGILSAAVVIDSTDPHAGAGAQWESEFCGTAHTTLAACLTVVLGTVTVSVDALGEATWDRDPEDPNTFTIDWGDGTVEVDGPSTHTYAEPGDYTIVVTGDQDGYYASIPITVLDGEVSGPFEAEATNTPPKDTDERAGWTEADPFTVYHISTCRLVGSADREAYATRALQLGEGRAIEAGTAVALSAAEADIEVLNSGDADTAAVALARVEAATAQRYGGIATIHMSREIASYLLTLDALVTKGDKLYTKLGNIVSAGAAEEYPGTPDGETTGTGESWIIGTGTVVVTRSPIMTTPAVISTGGLIDNEYSVLAERPVSVGWECFAVGYLVAALDAEPV